METEAPMIIIGWAVCAVGTAGFLNADYRADFPPKNDREARSSMAHCMGMGFLLGPLGIFFSLFVTGFWQDGWTLSARAGPEKGNS